MEVLLYSFLITALDGGVFAFTPPAAPYPKKRKLAGHQSWYEKYGEEISSPPCYGSTIIYKNVFKYFPLISRTTLLHGVRSK
jgi:hypothetical protein